jgi:hypothetical protein
MQRLNVLWQVISAASTVRDLARNRKTYHFAAGVPITFYLRTEQADVRIRRWNRPIIELEVRLQAPFGWQVAHEQDDAGVYVAARRRTLIGALSQAEFTVWLPVTAHLVLNLSGCTLHLEDVNGTLEFPADQLPLALLPAPDESAESP